jgi:hypothetical protein
MVSNTHYCKALIGKVSISLDAWTSSNGLAFLAIIAHYVTNDRDLGTFLSPLDFVLLTADLNLFRGTID